MLTDELVQVWMVPASGTSWTKIFSDSYNGGSWAVARLIQSRGQHSVNIPNVPAGDYLLRGKTGDRLTSHVPFLT